ncbi:MAG: S-methyl-5-thioribose-1-phosphate isomerase [Deltaproteobacteria bacterium]|nr:MAG: S-methyl-5-thioribose-1-phosphate isomerase [Deltaproteobacteria bacterium]
MSFQHIKWTGDELVLLDQRILPIRESYRRVKTSVEAANAIKTMVVRGAPAIGIVAAFGLVLAIKGALKRKRVLKEEFAEAYKILAGTRPTAVNLFYALERVRNVFERICDRSPEEVLFRVEKEALDILEEDVKNNRAIGKNGVRFVRSGFSILTHCNAGALATGGYGTALGVIRMAVEKGKKVHVYVDETRPFLQGARLTAWELQKEGIPCTLITDNMAGYLMAQGKVDMVIVGADRIAANGDVANKIGTYSLAVLAKQHKIPFYVAAPTSTIDMSVKSGKQIPIEERDAGEVTNLMGTRIAPHGVNVYNPAFDVTPSRFVSAIITEKGVVTSPYGAGLKKLFS